MDPPHTHPHPRDKHFHVDANKVAKTVRSSYWGEILEALTTSIPLACSYGGMLRTKSSTHPRPMAPSAVLEQRNARARGIVV